MTFELAAWLAKQATDLKARQRPRSPHNIKVHAPGGRDAIAAAMDHQPANSQPPYRYGQKVEHEQGS